MIRKLCVYYRLLSVEILCKNYNRLGRWEDRWESNSRIYGRRLNWNLVETRKGYKDQIIMTKKNQEVVKQQRGEGYLIWYKRYV